MSNNDINIYLSRLFNVGGGHHYLGGSIDIEIIICRIYIRLK